MLAPNYPPRREDDIDGWFDYFQREIANYKQAIRRIIQDVVQLREQHHVLTAANKDLKVKIENYDKKKRVLYEIFEGDKLDKAKMQDIFSKSLSSLSGSTFAEILPRSTECEDLRSDTRIERVQRENHQLRTRIGSCKSSASRTRTHRTCSFSPSEANCAASTTR